MTNVITGSFPIYDDTPDDVLRIDNLQEFMELFYRLDLPAAELGGADIYMKHPLLSSDGEIIISFSKRREAILIYPDLQSDSSGTYFTAAQSMLFPRSENEIKDIYLKIFNKLNRIYMERVNKETDSILSVL